MNVAAACRNCKHFGPDRAWAFSGQHISRGRCRHPSQRVVDIVTGEVLFARARDARSDRLSCGPSGALYEEERNPVVRFVREAPPPDPALLPVLVALILLVVAALRRGMS